jgi:hypothetical protein
LGRRRRGIERKRIEVRLGLLQVSQARGTLAFVARDERSHRELCERHRGDQRLDRKRRRIRQPGNSG